MVEEQKTETGGKGGIVKREEKEEERKLSIRLGIGILFFPLLFSWFTLRKGYSKLVKGVAFGWLVVSLGIYGATDGQEKHESLEGVDGVTSDGSSAGRPPIVPGLYKSKKMIEEEKRKKEEEERIAAATAAAARLEAETYSVGDTFEVSGFAYLISDIEYTTSIGGRWSRERSNSDSVFCVVHFKIKNLQQETDTTDADNFYLIDQYNRKYKPSSRVNTILAMSGRKDMFFSQLQPGITKDSMTAFEIPIASAVGELFLIVPEKGLFAIRSKRVRLPSASFKKKKRKKRKKEKWEK